MFSGDIVNSCHAIHDLLAIKVMLVFLRTITIANIKIDNKVKSLSKITKNKKILKTQHSYQKERTLSPLNAIYGREVISIKDMSNLTTKNSFKYEL